jgi:hypothetical protein
MDEQEKLEEIAEKLVHIQAQVLELTKIIERLKRQLEGVKDQPKAKDKSA